MLFKPIPIIIMAILCCLLASCQDKVVHTLTFKNNANISIYYAISYAAPDTSIVKIDYAELVSREQSGSINIKELSNKTISPSDKIEVFSFEDSLLYLNPGTPLSKII